MYLKFKGYVSGLNNQKNKQESLINKKTNDNIQRRIKVSFIDIYTILQSLTLLQN